jgi:DNA-binding CsgD family transcriptional regulator
MPLPQPDWHAALGKAISTLEKPGFAPAMVAALRHVGLFDYCVVFGYSGAGRPADLYDDFGPARRDVFVADYQSGPYLLDPLYHATRQRLQSGLYRLRDLAPDRFYQSEYYRSYYVRTGLAEEIAFIAHPNDRASVVLSLMRAGHRLGFSTREFRDLRAVSPVVIAAMAQNWRGFGRRARSGPPPEPTPMSDFGPTGKPRLTRREAEVVSLVLRGHSSESISRQLGIASGTVKIHRKNLYAKLGISSQAELFSLFLTTIGRNVA